MRQGLLKERNITRVLKVNGIRDRFPNNVAQVKIVDMDDMPDYDITDANLIESFNFICPPEGGDTLVVCTAGVSRSATICISWLMWKHGKSLSEAFGMVKRARPLIRPNNGFQEFLIKFEKRLKNDR